MATQRIRLKDADGNVLLPETGIDLIRGAQKAPGFMAFGTYNIREENGYRAWFPAFAVYQKLPDESQPSIVKIYYIDMNSATIQETAEINNFLPLNGYFAQ